MKLTSRQCAYHPDRKAANFCNMCGNAICDEDTKLEKKRVILCLTCYTDRRRMPPHSPNIIPKVTVADIHLLDYASGLVTGKVSENLHVKITPSVLDTILDRCKTSKLEVMGILTGQMQDQYVEADDFVHGPTGTEMNVQPKTEELAAMFQTLIQNGKRMVGWYHSHPGLGVFMSETDITTHRNLAQFGNLVALVIDPRNDQWKFFAFG